LGARYGAQYRPLWIAKPRAAVQAKTFGDIIDLHIEDMLEVGRPPRRSKAAVLEALKEALGTVTLPKLNRERLIEFGRQRAKEGAGPATLAIDFSLSGPSLRTPQRSMELRCRPKRFAWRASQ